MAEYRLEFEADSGAAERSIFNLRKSIKEVTKEFEKSEIGAEDFVAAASEISKLKKEYNDARNAVANIDKAYRDLNKAIEANFAAHTKATSAASKYHKDVLQLAQESAREQDRLRDRQFKADVEAFDMKVKLAAVASKKIAAQEKAIMEFRAGMGARGAIPAIASPIRGGLSFPDSPDYKKAMADAAAKAAGQAKAGGGVTIPAELKFQPFSLAYYESKLKTLSAQARLIAPESKQWKALNKEILEAERGIAIIQKRQRLGPTMGQRAGAAGGAFLYGGGLGGGIGSALGGIAGGLAGGVPGAFTGAAIGQLTDNLGNIAAATATYTAQIDRQRLALKNVIGDVTKYKDALGFIDDTSRKLAIPQDVLNTQFTQLSASVIGAGGNVDVAKEAFLGIAAGIRGTGGSLADMESALRATAQVFSKGKVSAEELRQQIGERMPGAFTLFAKSMNKTPQELDKMLEQGQVTLNDFVTFVRALSAKYGASALEMAASSQAAGDRMTTTVSRMREAVGRELQPLGAQFQEAIANAVAGNEENLVAIARAFSQAAQAIGSFIGKYGELIASLGSAALLFGGTILAVKGISAAFVAIGPAIETVSVALASSSKAVATLKLAMAGLGGPITLTIAGLVLLAKGVYDTNETFRDFVNNIGGVVASDFRNAVDGMATDAGTATNNIQTAYEDLTAKLDPIGDFIRQLFKDVFKDTSDSAEKSATTSSNAFNDFFNGLAESAAGGFNGLNTVISNWWSGLPAPIRSIFEGNAASLLIGAGQYAAALPGRTQRGRGSSYVLGGEQLGPALPPGLPNRNKPRSTDLPFPSATTSGEDAARKKQQSLESFERLRDQLANAYNQAEIERIKQRYELEKRLRDDLFDKQEFGANRLQRQALGFLRSLVKAEDERAEAVMSARLAVAAESGKVAGGAGVSGISGGGFSTAQLQKASQEAARFTGVANMCSESVKAFYKSLGISLPGVTAWADTVRNAGQTMTDWSKLQAGDIVATGRPGDTPHVGVYTGGNNVFHQSRKRGLKAGNYPDLDYFKSGYFVRPNAVGAGSPRKVGSNESRDTMAVANLEIAQATVLETARGAQLAKNSALMREFEKFAADAYNIPDLELDNRRLAERNRLAEQGLDENAINYQLRLLDIEEQRQFLIAKLPEFIRNNNYEEKDHVAILGLLAAAIAKVMGAEKKKNDETLRGIEEQRQRDITKRIDALKAEVEILRLVSAEERRLAELRKEGLSEAQAKKLFDLEKIKKNIEDTRALIDGFVSQTSSDYKGFLKAVISGEDAADALKQFQEGLKDRVLTIFLDFAMAPVEKFLKESLEGLFLPKAPKELKPEEEKAKTGIEGNTVATNENTTELKNLTTAIQGMAAGATSPTSNAAGLFNAAPAFNAGTAFGGTSFAPGAEAMVNAMNGIDYSSIFKQSTEAMTSSLAESATTSFASLGFSLNDTLSKTLEQAKETTDTKGAEWQKSLGNVVGAIGIAAGAIMGIAAGIGQIKKGGASNILGGIGSIMVSIGGAMSGIMGMIPKGGKAANGAVWKGGFQAFANGGTVTGPTLGLIGEGKYNEAIVPLPDGRSIPVQMRGGASRDLLNAPGSAPAAPTMLSMSFQSTTINGVEYVDRAQLEAAMAETRKSAARDGASRGASLALDKLQNSPSARRRVGIR